MWEKVVQLATLAEMLSLEGDRHHLKVRVLWRL
jgi:hypothetical protein